MDEFPRAPEQAAQPRRGAGFRATLGVALLSFLIGIALVGYLAWRSGVDLDRLIDPSREAATDEPLTPAVSGAMPAAPQSEVAREAVAIVAQQQGGLDQRLAALEQRMARLDLQAQAAGGNAGRAEALLVAFAARRAIDRGAPLGYLADQLRLRFGDAKPIAVQTVIDAARDPVTTDKLVARLDGMAPALENATGESGFVWLRREMSALFVIRRESAPSPEPHKRLQRARWFLESGRVEAAIAEVQNLPGADEAGDWIVDAQRYAGAQRALDLLETSALLEPRDLRDGGGNKVEQPSPVAGDTSR
jgi:hypothetical protein